MSGDTAYGQSSCTLSPSDEWKDSIDFLSDSYAGPNTTDEPRRAYIQTFGLPTSRREKPQDFPWQRMQQTARAERAQQAKTS